MNSRIFKTRFFARQMQKIGLSDELLLNAMLDIALIKNDLQEINHVKKV